MPKISRLVSILALSAGTAVSAGAHAAEGAWQHTLGLYMVAPWIQGDAGVGPIEGEVDVKPADVFDNLDGAFLAFYRGERDRLVVTADVNYMTLGSKASGFGPSGQGRVAVDSDQLILEGTLGYKLNEVFAVYGGARYWDLELDLNLQGALIGTEKRSGGESWVDPIVGLHYMSQIADPLYLVAKADIGGFGVGSDFSWGGTLMFVYQLNSNASLLFGYRHMDVDYDEGKDEKRVLWDVWEGGPTLGLAWTF
jgi:hypothetical protein